MRLLGEARILGTGLANLIWIVFAGLWLAIGHAVAGLLCCLTIIGIPLGVIHFKMAGVCFAPLGKRVVDKALARAAIQNEAQRRLAAAPTAVI